MKFLIFTIVCCSVFALGIAKTAGKFCDKIYQGKKLLFGNFSSPNYPEAYPNNTKCTYKFIRDNNKEWTTISFLDFELYNDTGENDTSGNLGNSSFLSFAVRSSQGLAQRDRAENPGIIYTNERTYTIEFNGMYNLLNKRGFFGTFEFKDNYCNEVFESKKQKFGVFSSPLYPKRYLEYSNCTYEFRGEPNELVQIVFQDFDLYEPRLEKNVYECADGDSMVSYKRYNREIEICGKITPLPILSEQLNFSIIFNASNVPLDATVRGFNATYNFIQNFGIEGEQLPPEGSCTFQYNSSVQNSGVITSPNFPGFYPNMIMCYYYFTSESEQIVVLNFTNFNLLSNDGGCSSSSSNDYVSFSTEENDPSSELVFCGLQEPFVIVSNKSYAQVIFFSKGDRYNPHIMKENIGFIAEYEFTANDTMTEPSFAHVNYPSLLIIILNFSVFVISSFI